MMNDGFIIVVAAFFLVVWRMLLAERLTERRIERWNRKTENDLPEKPSVPPKHFVLPPPAVAVLLLGLGWFLSWMWPPPPNIRWSFPVAGALVMLAGAIFSSWGFLIFRRARTTIMPGKEPAFLVLGGPYRVSRNPMYVGMTAFLFGCAVLAGSPWWLSAPIGFMIVMDIHVIPSEEKMLLAKFCKSYHAYCERVRRWL